MILIIRIVNELLYIFQELDDQGIISGGVAFDEISIGGSEVAANAIDKTVQESKHRVLVIGTHCNLTCYIENPDCLLDQAEEKK